MLRMRQAWMGKCLTDRLPGEDGLTDLVKLYWQRLKLFLTVTLLGGLIAALILLLIILFRLI